MSVLQTLTIKGDGPTGTTILTLDKNGIADGSGNLMSMFTHITWPLLAASVSNYIWQNVGGIWMVQSARAIVGTAGGSGATVDVQVCAGLTAPASGVTQLSTPLVLTTTGPSRSIGTLIASPTTLVPGDSISAVFAGTLTALVGQLQVNLKRIG